MCFFRSRQTASASSAGISTILILMSEPCHTGVSLYCLCRSWLATFPMVARRSLHELAHFPYGKVMACNTCWLTAQTNVSVCFIQFSKNTRLISLSKPICIQINFDRMISFVQTEDAGKGVYTSLC